MSMMQDIVSFDPARPSVEVARVRVDAGAVDAAVRAARAAFPAWSARSVEERAALLEAWSATCARHAERIAVAIMRETGKVLAEARQEAALLSDKVAVTLEERVRARVTGYEFPAMTRRRTRARDRRHGRLRCGERALTRAARCSA